MEKSPAIAIYKSIALFFTTVISEDGKWPKLWLENSVIFESGTIFAFEDPEAFRRMNNCAKRLRK